MHCLIPLTYMIAVNRRVTNAMPFVRVPPFMASFKQFVQ